MISIIVSSYNEKYYNQFEQNVQQTIGVPYEIIKIYNPGSMGICEAYNKGTQQAKYEMLCFSHEDILFRTSDWGKRVVSILADQTVGLVGVAGSKYKSYMPSGWSFVEANEVTPCCNLIQTFRHTLQNTVHALHNPDGAKASQVVCVDGVWMCTRKNVLDKISFDQNTLTGFHCYDLDISLQIFQQYKVLVTYEVLLEHFSEGNTDKSWIKEVFKIQNKWKKILPENTSSLTKKEQQIEEYKAFHKFLVLLYQNDQPLSDLLAFVFGNLSYSLRAMGVKNVVKLATKLVTGYYRKQPFLSENTYLIK